jgi:hypothetical protein
MRSHKLAAEDHIGKHRLYPDDRTHKFLPFGSFGIKHASLAAFFVDKRRFFRSSFDEGLQEVYPTNHRHRQTPIPGRFGEIEKT